MIRWMASLNVLALKLISVLVYDPLIISMLKSDFMDWFPGDNNVFFVYQ
jgi:hypothetical protein